MKIVLNDVHKVYPRAACSRCISMGNH